MESGGFTKNRTNNTKITFDIFKTYLKNALNIEKHIAVNGNRYDTFCETFDAVVKNLAVESVRCNFQ